MLMVNSVVVELKSDDSEFMSVVSRLVMMSL